MITDKSNKRLPSSKKSLPRPIELLNKLIANEAASGGGQPPWLAYFKPIPELSQGLPAPILGIMLLIWQLRDKDLQVKFSLKTRQSRLAFLAWCITSGHLEYRSLAQADLFWLAVNAPAGVEGDYSADDAGHVISWKMKLIALQRKDLEFDLATPSGRAAFVYWYLCHGRIEHGFAQECLRDWQIKHFFSAAATTLPLTRLQALVYLVRSDVSTQFPLATHHANYIAWFRHFISSATSIIQILRSPIPSQQNEQPIKREFGVNVIGYAYGQLGIGEDARMAMRSLLSANIPALMLNFSPGKDIPQNDFSLDAYVASEARYAINMVCLTALEHGRYFAEHGGEFLRGRHNIGYWPWELEQWPTAWQHLTALIDEAWLSSPHTAQALQGTCVVPSQIMPMAVVNEMVAASTREDFGLPEHACLFLFAFDLNSSAKRKNPGACLAAFLQAFPKRGAHSANAQQVGLVIKVHPPVAPNAEWEALKALQATDPRIYLIEKTLAKEELLALYKVCDCFVSLHRAEGFGRCIAEAMLLGKAVITTAYSGNMAFTTRDNSLLVGYSLVPLVENDYPYGAGQQWAEVSIEHAAREMRRVYSRAPEIKEIAGRAQATIATLHNPTHIGRNYATRLLNFMSGIQGD